MKRMSVIVIWILFGFLLFWRVAVESELDSGKILNMIVIGLSISLLIKCRMPSGKSILIAILLSVLATVAFLGYVKEPVVLITGLIISGIPTFVTSLAVFSVMEASKAYTLVHKSTIKSVLTSVAIAIAVGAVLSGVNSFLDIFAGKSVQFDFSLWKLLVCFHPAIYEEMACRAIFMAYFVQFSEDGNMSWFEKFTMYFMMIIPHSLIHGYDLINTVMLGVLFGLPFALLQRKRDLTSAMISHGLVDAVRFTLFGM